jgi:hypothetical protein
MSDNYRLKTVYRVNGRDIEISELTVGQIKSLIPQYEKDFLPNMESLVETACGLKSSDIDQLSPSQLKGLYAKFKEVNADFFGVIRALGLIEPMVRVWNELKKHCTNHLIGQFAVLFGPDTGTPSDMDGLSSDEQLMS